MNMPGRADLGVEIGDRDGGVVALRIGHGPLLELKVLGAEHHHQPAGADERLALLDHDGDEHVVGMDADHVGVAQQVDAVGQQEAQRRLRQRIDVLGRSLRSRTTTDGPSATMSIGVGGSYSNRTWPGFWM